MSDTPKRPYAEMLPKAQAIVQSLQPYVTRIEIAGSLRRAEAMIGDVEIVAIPVFYADLFGELTTDSAVDTWMGSLRNYPTFSLIRGGDKLKSFHLEGVKVDLFLQPDPATWGVNYLIRTGPWFFSRWLVTKQQHGGACPNDLSVSDARIWCNGTPLPTPDEEDVFRLFGMEWIAPADRAAITPEKFK